MDGILIIDKPAGITSHDVVSRVRHILKTKRVGHTGTLDPFATGVMVILVGQATRLAQFLDKDAKEYVAGIKFGFETDTADLSGKRLENHFNRAPDTLTIEELESVVSQFRGTLKQTPPMYSAKKIDGQKLYELARQGKVVERNPVTISIYELAILDPDELAGNNSVLHIRVSCSAGTYIRTLAEDIGKAAGTGAHLISLRRMAAGKFDLRESRTLDELKALKSPWLALLPMDQAVSHLPEFGLPADRIEKTRNGLSTRVIEDRFNNGDVIRMTEISGNVIAIGVYDEAEKSVRPTVVLV